MKVDPHAPPSAVAATQPAQPFKKVLSPLRAQKKAPSPVAPKVPVGAPRPPQAVATGAPKPLPKTPSVLASVRSSQLAAASASAVSATRQQARAHVDGEAQRLSDVRTGHAKTAQALTEVRTEGHDPQVDRSAHRLAGLIHRELSQEASPPARDKPTPLEPVVVASPAAAGPQAGAPQKLDAPQDSRADQAVALIEKIEAFVKSNRPALSLTLNNSLGAAVEIERVGPKEIALKLTGRHGPPSAETVSRLREALRARGLKVSALTAG